MIEELVSLLLRDCKSAYGIDLSRASCAQEPYQTDRCFC